jgi:hypothetical protein
MWITMKNYWGGGEIGFFLPSIQFRKYMSYGFPIINFCNLAAHNETHCIFRATENFIMGRTGMLKITYVFFHRFRRLYTPERKKEITFITCLFHLRSKLLHYILNISTIYYGVYKYAKLILIRYFILHRESDFVCVVFCLTNDIFD